MPLCKYFVCENYALVFRDYTVDPLDLKVSYYFLCGVEIPIGLIIRLNPPTGGVAVLSIDGGGTRGILSLEDLKRIQDRLDDRAGVRIAIQRFFKVVVGTSSGALSTGGLFTIDKCREKFKELLQRSFKPRKFLGIPLPYYFRLALGYILDGLYSEEYINAALKEAFGVKRSILDHSYATSIGAKVGLTVATVNNPSVDIFTNYNGIGARDTNQGYHVIKPDDAYGCVPFWEVARCASAAPGFFPPKKINGVGTFQDAGPLENDPLVVALSEAAVLFPLAEPDFIVSLGTGFVRAKEDISTPVSNILHFWKNRAASRLWRLFWEKMNDRQIKQVFRTHPRYHRVDIEFDDELPRLDNTECIHELQLKAQADHSITKDIDKIACCAIASLFYFKLDSVPERYNREYKGIGFILCSLGRADPALKALLDQLSKTSATFYINDCPLPGIVGDCSFIGKDGNFRKRVDLCLSGSFAITLKQADSEPFNISGSPYSIEKLIIAQRFNSYFGRADHSKRKRSADNNLSARKRQRI